MGREVDDGKAPVAQRHPRIGRKPTPPFATKRHRCAISAAMRQRIGQSLNLPSLYRPAIKIQDASYATHGVTLKMVEMVPGKHIATRIVNMLAAADSP